MEGLGVTEGGRRGDQGRPEEEHRVAPTCSSARLGPGRSPAGAEGRRGGGRGCHASGSPPPSTLQTLAAAPRPQLIEVSGQDGSGAQPEPLPQGGPGQEG